MTRAAMYTCCITAKPRFPRESCTCRVPSTNQVGSLEDKKPQQANFNTAGPTSFGNVELLQVVPLAARHWIPVCWELPAKMLTDARHCRPAARQPRVMSRTALDAGFSPERLHKPCDQTQARTGQEWQRSMIRWNVGSFPPDLLSSLSSSRSPRCFQGVKLPVRVLRRASLPAVVVCNASKRSVVRGLSSSASGDVAPPELGCLIRVQVDQSSDR